MNTPLTRPDHLPDFGNPPLNEVVLGIQFAPAAGYQQIRAGEVWGLFKDEFPLVEELPPLVPSFETFGLPPRPSVGFGVITGAQHDRFWFLSSNKDELIQFQQDRLLHNWRKVGDQTNEYPRFEKMIARFQDEARTLETYFSTLSPQKLSCNQAEISYINHIRIGEEGGLHSATEVFSFLNFPEPEPEEVSASFRRIILDESGNPVGRLTCELNSAIDIERHKILILNLTARGMPTGSDIDAAIHFLVHGRDVVVNEFAAITTEKAHKIWERHT